MELSNYSMEHLVEEWLLDRKRAPILLKVAVEKSGPHGVIEYAISLGVPRMLIMRALRDAGCIPRAEKKADADPFRTKVERLYRKNPERLIAIIEDLHADR